MEDTDQLVKANLHAWKFSKHQTGGLAQDLSAIDKGDIPGKPADEEADTEPGYVGDTRENKACSKRREARQDLSPCSSYIGCLHAVSVSQCLAQT